MPIAKADPDATPVLVLETPAVVVGDVVTVGDVVIVGAGAGSTGVGVGVGVGVSVGVGVVGTGAVSTGVGVGVGTSGVVVGTTGMVVAAVSVIMMVFFVESRMVESFRIESFTCGVGFVGGLTGGVWADTIAGNSAKPAAAPSSRSFIFSPFGLCDW